MHPPDRGPTTHRLLVLLLVLAFLHDLLYLVTFPPWQHYDEPTHFEYVRLIAQRGRLPSIGDYDLELRREIAASMVETRFWRDLAAPAIDFWSPLPPDIGITELVHPPLYYLLLALLQLPVGHQGIGVHLYLARLASVLLGLVVVAAGYGLVSELVPRRTHLPVAVATFVAFLPPFAALFSSVNNDVGAAAAVTLLLWAGVRLVRRGPSLGRGFIVLFLAGICAFTKSTASLVAASVIVVLIAGYLLRALPTPRLRRWFWFGVAVLALVFAGSAFTWGGQAAFWESRELAAAPNRLAADTPLGRSALVMSTGDQRYPRMLFQELPPQVGRQLAGRTVTLGAWVRLAEGEAGPLVLGLADGSTLHWDQVLPLGDWQFHTLTATMASDAPSVAVHLRLPVSEGAVQVVLMDGLVMAEGDHSGSPPPRSQGSSASALSWAGRPINNLLRNGSAEASWPGLRAWIGNVTLFRYPVTYVFHSLWDWERTGWIYGPDLVMLAESFWGRLGWNHLALPEWLFIPLLVLTLAGVAGAAWWLLRWLRHEEARQPWRVTTLALLGAAMLVGWGGAALRIHPVFATSGILWPVARYAAVVIVPTALLLCVGWAQLLPRRWTGLAAWIGLLGLISLAVYVLWSVVLPYYYGWPQGS